MNQFHEQLLAQATGESDPSVLRDIELILQEPQLEGYLGQPVRGSQIANNIRQIRRSR